MIPLARGLQGHGDSLYALHFDSFLADPASHLRRVAGFWEASHLAGTAEALSADVFKGLTDETGGQFDLFARAKSIGTARGTYADEVKEGILTARAVIEQTGLKGIFSAFGNCMFERCQHYSLPPHMMNTVAGPKHTEL
jgi:hypothetical protein